MSGSPIGGQRSNVGGIWSRSWSFLACARLGRIDLRSRGRIDGPVRFDKVDERVTRCVGPNLLGDHTTNFRARRPAQSA